MKYIDYLRWGSISALFLALLVPFIVATGTWGVPNLFFPYITGKNFLFRILVEVALLCYVLLALREPKYRPRPSLILWAVVAFVAWMGLATFFSVDPVKSLWSNFERMEGYLGLLHLCAWFVVAGAVLSAEKLWDRFFNASITIAAVQGAWALLQYAGVFAISTQSGARADTTFGNATYLAVYLLINVFLTLLMFTRLKDSLNKLTFQTLYGVALLLQVAGLFLTETRGAILGLGCGLVVAALYLILFTGGKESRTLRRVAIGGLVAVIVAGAAIFAIRDTEFVKNIPALRRIASISLSETTVTSRLDYIWPMALRGVGDRPLIGWGQENFNFIFNKYYEPGMYNQEQWFDRAHNQFLDWLVAGGIPAGLLYAALYALAVLAVVRSRHLSAGEAAALIGLLAAYTFNNLFVFDNLISGVYFFALLAYLHSLSTKESPHLAHAKPMGDHTLAIVAPIIAGAILMGAWALNAPALARAKVLVEALQTQEAGLNNSGVVVGVAKDPKKNLAQFQASLSTATWPGTALGFQETTEQLLQFASSIASQQSVNPQTKQDIYAAARGAIESLLVARPNDARLELFAASMLASYGQIAEALQYLEKALEHSPKKQQILIQIGLTKLQSGDSAGALAALKQAYDSAPAFDLARVLYAAGLYYAGQGAAADALLLEKYGTTVVDRPELLQTYLNLKLFDRAIAIWKVRVENAPNDTQTHLGLASVYFAAGQKANTIAELRRIAQLDPRAALEMENLIKQIEDSTLKPGQ